MDLDSPGYSWITAKQTTHSYDLQQMTRKKIPKPPLTPDAEEKIRQLEQQLTFEKLRAEGLDTMINIDFMPLQALRLLSVSSH